MKRCSLFLTVLAALAVGTPAAAHVPPASPPTGSGGPDLHSQNVKLMASVPGEAGSDLAFWGDLAFAGSYHGFRVIDISAPANPKVLADVHCDGIQGDVSVWDDLLFVSVDEPLTGPACGTALAADQNDPTTFEGIRIFDVSEPSDPQLVTGVSTDCGSHTHTLVPDLLNGRVLIYVSSYSLFGGGPNCGPVTGDDPLHGKISIVEVPLASPGDAAVIAEPRVDAAPLDAAFFGGNVTVGCHDISVFLELQLAAAACMTEAQLWDISDPGDPKTLAAVHITDPPFLQPLPNPFTPITFWHSATFTPDGKHVVFGDEFPPFPAGCHHPFAELGGRLWTYEIANPAHPISSFNIPRVQPESEYCSAHLFNFIPVRGRNILVSAWYGGGTNAIDLTDPANPVELGYYDPAGTQVWSAYWYNGFVYANDPARGFEVFLFSDAARAGARKLDHLNPQTQEAALP